MSQPFRKLEGVIAALPLANVDTDQILPARFMKTLSRFGLGRHLFEGLRTDDSGQECKDFVLNAAPWNRAQFLVTLDNFGCGSSREHAPWALLDFGIRCIIAPSFADIFSNNCAKNGILLVTLERAICDMLIADAQVSTTAHLSLDLEAQKLRRAKGKSIIFEIEADRKHRLINGLDDITQTLALGDIISQHDSAVCYPRPTVPRNVGAIAIGR